jgi:hypothetical protein
MRPEFKQALAAIKPIQTGCRQKRHCAEAGFLICLGWVGRKTAGRLQSLMRRTTIPFNNDADVSQYH